MSKRADEAWKNYLDGPAPMGIGEHFHFLLGYEQAEKDIIERACKWLFRHYAVNLIEFRKAMEEES